MKEPDFYRFGMSNYVTFNVRTKEDGEKIVKGIQERLPHAKLEMVMPQWFANPETYFVEPEKRVEE